MIKKRIWDVVVIGAGPSGAMAAYQLAHLGFTVLIVEKEVFPREKVCGCCFNTATLDALRIANLAHLPEQLGGSYYDRLQLVSRGKSTTISLPKGMAVSRGAFDHAMLQTAINAGTQILMRTQATIKTEIDLSDTCQIELKQDDQPFTIQSRIVLACSGLIYGAIPQKNDALKIDDQSRIGIGTIVPAHGNDDYTKGIIYMACGKNGYVGLVRLEDDRLNIAAALDPKFVKVCGSPHQAVAVLLNEAQMPEILNRTEFKWHGTPALTRKRKRLGSHRVFILGDAAGYIEPFTGEGIAWALSSGIAVVPLVTQAIKKWEPQLITKWEAVRHSLLSQRQFLCRCISQMLRHPKLTRFAIELLSMIPPLSTPVVHLINRRFRFKPI